MRRSRSPSPGREVPRLHPGVNDLIRVLGKQAHCSSRTLISCEPNCRNSHLRSKYHANCVATKIVRNWEPLCRPASLWSPIQLESYYYDCYFYRQFPDRDSEYQELLGKYNAIKEQKLDYSPPDCDEGQTRAVFNEPTLESNRSLAGKNKGISDHGAGPGTFSGNDYSLPNSRTSSRKDYSSGKDYSSRKGYPSETGDPSEVSLGGQGHRSGENYPSGRDDEYSFFSNKKKPLGSVSRKNLTSEGNSVPCSELAEIRDLLKQSDRETIRRLQEMLALMKELSIRDICRARCDGSIGTGTFKANIAQEHSLVSQGSRKRLQKREDSRGQPEKQKKNDTGFEHPQRETQDGMIVDSQTEIKIVMGRKASDTVPTPGTAAASQKRDDEDFRDDYMDGPAAGQYSAEPAQYSNRSIKQLQGSSKKAGQDDDYYTSDESSTSIGRESGKGKKQSSRKGKRKGNKGVSGYETDPTESSSSSLSEYSTDRSRSDLKGSGEDETDLESSDTEDESRRSHGKKGSSKRKPKSGKYELSSSETISIEGSTSSVSQKRGLADEGIPRKYSSGADQNSSSGGTFKLMVGKSQLTVHEAVELANKITDIIVLEMMDDLIRKRVYAPPSRRYEPGPIVTDRSRSLQQQGGPLTSPAQSNLASASKADPTPKLDRIDESSSRTHLSKTSLKKPAGSMLDTRKDDKTDLPQESKRLSCPRHSRSLSPSGFGSGRSPSCRLEIDRERARSADYKKPRQSSETREPPKPWERRLSSQMKLDAQRESSAQRSQKSKAASISNDRPSQKAYVLEPLAESSKLSSATYKTDIPRSRQSSKISQMSSLPGSARLSKTGEISKPQPERVHSLQGPSSKTLFDIHNGKAPSVSASGGQINQVINIQPTSVTEKEVSGGRVLSFTRTENVDVFVPEKGSITARPSGSQLARIASACEPDDLIAATYDTDDSILYYARITRNAFPPVKESYNAAGFMLRSAYDYSIPPRSKVSVKTDLVLQLPRNSYGRIAPRKCLVESYGIDVGADVIDRDFRGNISVVLFNHGDATFAIKRGNKVAQLICESIHLAKVQENSALLKG